MINQVLQAILDKYVLPLDGHHGVGHWARVQENGVRLAEFTGANVEVVSPARIIQGASTSSR